MIRRTLAIAATCAACLAAPLAIAQDAPEAQPGETEQETRDRTYLTRLIEENLSGAGREVQIFGFRGALSSEATFDRLTIADEEGIWITLTDGVLDWNRSALLRGAIDVTELSVAEVNLQRWPETEDGPSPTGRASFSLPELPVSVDIEDFGIDRVILGAPILGEEAELTVAGQAALEGGEGTAQLRAERTDGQRGILALEGAYSNATDVLSVELTLDEGEDGILVNVIDLPGHPAIEARIAGEDPLDDFTAEVALSTDGQDRLSGTIRLAAVPQAEVPPEDRAPPPAADAPAEPEAGPPARRFTVDLAGDISPLFETDYRDFFGSEVVFRLDGLRAPSGAVDLDSLILSAQSVEITGSAEIGPDGLPEAFALRGRLAAPGGEPVLLPLSGPRAYVDRAEITAQYDQQEGEEWTLNAALERYRRNAIEIGAVTLRGGGTIGRNTDPAGTPVNAVTGALSFDLEGFEHDDPKYQRAFGEHLSGALEAAWQEGEPVQVRRFALVAGDMSLDAAGRVDGLETGLTVAGRASLRADDLTRFAAALEQPGLQGAVDLAIAGEASTIGGAFDLEITGSGEDLGIGNEELDAIIAGEAELAIDVRRDIIGTTLRHFRLATPALTAEGSGQITEVAANLDIEAALDDAARVIEGATGPARLEGNLRQVGEGAYTADITASGPGAAELMVDAGITEVAGDDFVVDGDVTLRAASLAPYAALAGRPELGGAIDVALEGRGRVRAQTFDGTITGTARDLTTGIEPADKLLAGTTSFLIDGRRDEDAILLRELRVDGTALTARASGEYTDTNAELDLTARIDDMGRLVENASGPASIDAQLDRTGADTYALVMQGEGPGAAALDVDATITERAETWQVAGVASLQAGDIAPYARLAGQEGLRGAVDVQASGTATLARDDLAPRAFDITASGTARDFATGIPTADKLIAGRADFTLDAAQEEGGELDIRDFRITTPALTAEVDGSGRMGAMNLTLDARLDNLGRLVPDFPGPATLRGTARQQGEGRFEVDLAATGPGGTRADLAGTIATEGGTTLNLRANGQAPLGLANTYLDGISVQGLARFDVAVNGPPALSSVSGQVSTSGARIALPDQNLALTLAARADISGGRANLDASAQVARGGRITLTGPIALEPPFTANLLATLDNVVLEDPKLYRTSASGRIRVAGPLTGGGRISGRIELGETEVKVPDSGFNANQAIPPITHVGDSPAVRATRDRAGIKPPAARSGGTRRGGGGFALDVVISAPNRVFIRGRGLDAELGGEIRLEGETGDIVPSGQFELIRGRLDILGKRLELEEGRLTLRGTTTPDIRLVADTETEDALVQIIVEGPADEIEVTFNSIPELPEDEVLARLLFGRGLTNLTAFQAAQLAAAVATLAGRGGEGIIGRIRKAANLDDLDITTTDDGEAAVKAGKYVNEDTYTNVTVDSSGRAEIELNLDLTPDLSARGSLASDGETGLGIFFEKDY